MGGRGFDYGSRALDQVQGIKQAVANTAANPYFRGAGRPGWAKIRNQAGPVKTKPLVTTK